MPRDVFDANYPFLPSSERLSFDHLVKIARSFAAIGVEKIRITGGEPLLRRNLESLIEQLARLKTVSGKPMDIALTTNGSLLASKARSLRDAGLNRVTVSLDALDDALFRRMSDVDIPVTRVLDGIEHAISAGFTSIKVNAVIERGTNETEILSLVRYFKNTDVAVRFIEYMDVGGANTWAGAKVFTSGEVLALVESEFSLVPVPTQHPSDTAVNYRHADGTGEIGCISSVSKPFCGNCSRARVSANGQLYTCLFATRSTDLRPWLDYTSSDTQLIDVIRSTWVNRTDRYSEQRGRNDKGKAYPTVRMSLVGG